MIKIIIGNSYSKIVGYLDTKVQNQLDYCLSYFVQGAIHSKAYKEKKWDGRHRCYQIDKGQSFYTGLLSIVCDVLDQNHIAYTKDDRRVVPVQNIPYLQFTYPKGFEQRDYQEFTVGRGVSRTRGILKMATGAGKTLTVAQLIGEIKTAPFMFYVLTTDLLNQAYDTLSATLNVPIGRIGGGHFDIKDINVCTIQTVVRAINDKSFKISDYMFDSEESWDEEDFLDIEKKEAIRKLLINVKGVYLDECHHASSKMCMDVIGASPNCYWRYGGTATPYREDNAEIVLQGIFGKKIVDISASYLINKGYLLEPYIIFDPITHIDPPSSYQSIYSQCVVKNNDFHERVAMIANHLISKNLSTLILVQRYEHGDLLKALIPNIEFVTGKMSQSKREKCIQDLRDKKTLGMIATTLADEGLDVPTLDAALLAGGGASATRVNQRIGRTLRPDRKSTNPRDKSVVVVFDHKVKHLSDQTTKIKKMLKEEPKFNLLKSHGKDEILNQIDSIMGTGKQEPSIFD